MVLRHFLDKDCFGKWIEVDGSGLLVSLSHFFKPSEGKEAEIVAETVADLDESPSKALGLGGTFGVAPV